MKTIREFDYDLWAIDENGRKRFYVRVKETGEETEVTQEVMRYLQSQEKQMRRVYLKQQDEGELLSLNTLIYDIVLHLRGGGCHVLQNIFDFTCHKLSPSIQV